MAPPLPQRPACWRWRKPPLPQPSDLNRIRQWQAGRCAVCGRTDRKLHEDHDHASLDTRGFLCPRCNAVEGLSFKGYMVEPAVFSLYRETPPSAIFGIRHRYGQRVHPDDVAAVWRVHRALTLNSRPESAHDLEIVRLAERLAAVGFTFGEHLERKYGRRDATEAA